MPPWTQLSKAWSAQHGPWAQTTLSEICHLPAVQLWTCHFPQRPSDLPIERDNPHSSQQPAGWKRLACATILQLVGITFPFSNSCLSGLLAAWWWGTEPVHESDVGVCPCPQVVSQVAKQSTHTDPWGVEAWKPCFLKMKDPPWSPGQGGQTWASDRFYCPNRPTHWWRGARMRGKVRFYISKQVVLRIKKTKN